MLAPIWLRRRRARTESPESSRPSRVRKERVARPDLELPCPNCQGELALFKEDLRPLIEAETALIVGQFPHVVGRKLIEARCPRCDASLTFFADTKPLELLGVNIFEAQTYSNLCAQCREPLLRPAWPQGEFEGRSDALAYLQPRHGLECEKCGAACCVGCCEEIALNRTTDGTVFCPRCRDGPLENIYYF